MTTLTAFGNFIGLAANIDGREYGPQYFKDCLNVFVDGGIISNYTSKSKFLDLVTFNSGTSLYQAAYGIFSYISDSLLTNALVVITNVGPVIMLDDEIRDS